MATLTSEERQAEREARKAEFDALPKKQKKAIEVDRLARSRDRIVSRITSMQEELAALDAELSRA